MTKMEAPQYIKRNREAKIKLPATIVCPGPARMPAIDLDNDTIADPGDSWRRGLGKKPGFR
jgi:hypothetical protein